MQQTHHDPSDHPSPVSRRTRIGTALAALAVSSPSIVLSGLLVFGVGALFGPWFATGLTLTWLLCGPLVPAPTADMAPRIFPVRRAHPAEQAALIPAWHNVAAAAGVRVRDYSLWVQDSDHLNALAAPGRIVVVTGWAVAALGPRELEAVLAHELGHHLGGGQRARMTAYWYGLPVATIRGGYRRITWLFAVFVAKAAHIVGLVSLLRLFGVRNAMDALCFAVLAPSRIALLAAAAVGAALIVGPPPVVLGAVALAVEPFAVAAQRRRSEIQADRVAVDLGYGPETRAVLELWSRRHPTRRAPSMSARLLDSHPPVDKRVRAIRTRAGDRRFG